MSNKGETTRTEIVSCARDLFYRRGYDGTSFSDIVKASDVCRGNIYHYFKSKDEILGAVIDQRIEEFQTLLNRWQVEHTDPRERLRAFARMVVERQDELTRWGCPVGSLNIELGKDRRDLQVSARRLFDLFRDWLATQLAALGHADPAAAALHLLGRAQGIAVIAQVYEDTTLLAREVAWLEEWIERCGQ